MRAVPFFAKYLPLLSLCFAPGLLKAQWQAYVPALPDTIGTFDLCIAHQNDQVVWSIGMKYNVLPTSFGTIHTDSLFFTKTADGGQSWSGGTIPRGGGAYAQACSICPINADTAWACMVDNLNKSHVMQTTDGGQSWTPRLENGFGYATSYVNAVYFWDDQHGVAIGDPAPSATQTLAFFEIYTTDDGGDTWTRISNDSIPARLTNEFGYYGDYAVVGDHIWFSSFSPGGSWRRVFHSTDRGHHWTAATASVGSISFADELHGVGNSYNASTQATSIRYTENGGASWTILPAIQGARVSTLVILPESHHLLAVQRTNNISGPFRTMLSTDLGQSWMEIGVGEHAAQAQFSTASTGYAGEWLTTGHPTRMYRYTGSPMVGIFTGNTLDARVVCAPNPVAEVLRVEVLAEEGQSAYCLLLNDEQGRLVARKWLAEGAAEWTEFDVKNLPPGVYWLTVSGEKGYLTRKVVKL